jgi:jasmonate ZIM domain-containing protein
MCTCIYPCDFLFDRLGKGVIDDQVDVKHDVEGPHVRPVGQKSFAFAWRRLCLPAATQLPPHVSRVLRADKPPRCSHRKRIRPATPIKHADPAQEHNQQILHIVSSTTHKQHDQEPSKSCGLAVRPPTSNSSPTTMAAAEAGAGSGTATTTATTTSRFAAACCALSRYVKAAERARASRPLPLMPGADVTTAESGEKAEAEPAPSQLTIFYGGQVLVLDDVPADKAASLLHAAAEAARVANNTVGLIAATDLPVARKASLQRFMEKRRARAARRSTPYGRPDGDEACSDRLELAL